MSVDFSQVKGIKIPQGNVERITIGNTVVWQATRSWKTIQSASDYTIIQYGISIDGIFQNGTNYANRIGGTETNWLPHLYKVNGNNTLIRFVLEKADSTSSTNYTAGSYYYINTTGNLGIPSTDSPDWKAFVPGDTYGEDWTIELDLRLCKNSLTQIPLFVIRSGTNSAGSSYYACSIVGKYDQDKDCYYVGLVGNIYGNPYDRAVIRYRGVSSYNLFGVPALDPGWITVDNTTRTMGSASTYKNITNFATLPANPTKIKLTLKYVNKAPNNSTDYNTNMRTLQSNMGFTKLNKLLTAPNTEFTLEANYDPNRPYLFVVGSYKNVWSASLDYYISLKQVVSMGEITLSLIKSGTNEDPISSVTPSSSVGIYPFSITKIEAYFD